MSMALSDFNQQVDSNSW